MCLCHNLFRENHDLDQGFSGFSRPRAAYRLQGHKTKVRTFIESESQFIKYATLLNNYL
jgi:hypothetical protein